MIKRLPNGNLLYLQGYLTPYQARSGWRRMLSVLLKTTDATCSPKCLETDDHHRCNICRLGRFLGKRIDIEPDIDQEQIAAMLTISENIQEQIEIAGELWELSDFEVTLCGIVADAFADQGIKMEALI